MPSSRRDFEIEGGRAKTAIDRLGVKRPNGSPPRCAPPQANHPNTPCRHDVPVWAWKIGSIHKGRKRRMKVVIETLRDAQFHPWESPSGLQGKLCCSLHKFATLITERGRESAHQNRSHLLELAEKSLVVDVQRRPAAMEVTNRNFAELLPRVEAAIASAHFLAIDGEFSGLSLTHPQYHTLSLLEFPHRNVVKLPQTLAYCNRLFLTFLNLSGYRFSFWRLSMVRCCVQWRSCSRIHLSIKGLCFCSSYLVARG